MEVIVKENVEEMSKLGAEIVAEVLNGKKSPVLGLATGSTPVKMYKELIRMNKEGKMDFSNVRSFNLDEYVGVEESHSQSYHYFMWENLFKHINIKKENTNVPNGIAEDIPEACKLYEEKIIKCGGVDIQVLGIGSNGHIAFNEPGSSSSSRTRIIALDERTIDDNARFFAKKEDVPRYAVSMGIGTILEAKKIILLANGKNKAEAVAKSVEGPITAMVPASFLQMHQDTIFILDQEASSLLKRKYSTERFKYIPKK
ncbi:MAG: glucosamine-6-phosphate deaminase [Candidatus Firestonebacteria bacterium]